jgi:hypothetical protein
MSGRKLIVDWKHTADELYARYKQVRRRWTARGVKLRRRVERRYVWRYLQVAVDPLTGQLWWRWSERLRREDTLAALLAWRSLGVAVVVWDNAGCHRARCVREAGVGLVFLPAYSPELTPVERVFCELRRCVEGVLYETIEAKMAAVEGALVALSGSSGSGARLVGWDWIREALEGLPSD